MNNRPSGPTSIPCNDGKVNPSPHLQQHSIFCSAGHRLVKIGFCLAKLLYFLDHFVRRSSETKHVEVCYIQFSRASEDHFQLPSNLKPSGSAGNVSVGSMFFLQGEPFLSVTRPEGTMVARLPMYLRSIKDLPAAPKLSTSILADDGKLVGFAGIEGPCSYREHIPC